MDINQKFQKQWWICTLDKEAIELSASEGIKHTGIVDELQELYASDSHDIVTPFAESRMAKKTLCSCVPSAYLYPHDMSLLCPFVPCDISVR